MSSLQPPMRPGDGEILSALDFLRMPRPTQPAIIALRRPEEPGSWNDILGVLGGGKSYWVVGTTDPGSEVMAGKGRIPTHPLGAARVRAGYHKGFFYPGYHKQDSSHPALRQVADRVCPVERWDDALKVWRIAPAAVGPYNLHRATWTGSAPAVGDYSHGCLVAQVREEHWNLLLAAGYPEHGPSQVQQDTMRWDLYLLDWSAYLRATARQ